jgi:uncharacterized protein YbjT (DUF2867 family)
MRVAILGASGYIGTHLIERLLAETDHTLVAISPSATDIAISSEKLEKTNCNIFDTLRLHESLEKCDVVYYLVHMMAQKKYDFAEAESLAAHSLVKAIQDTKVERIIYLGGLGNDKDKLSKHLASRHHTGEILRLSNARIIEFRASMVIGRGSISYDIITNLVHKLPILTLPSWSKTLTQPIALYDAISYLVASIGVIVSKNEIVEVGGPEQLSYKELMKRYATWKGSKSIFIGLPVIPIPIAAWWLNVFTPKKHAKVGRSMVESLGNPMVVTNTRSKELFPQIETIPIDKAFA